MNYFKRSNILINIVIRNYLKISETRYFLYSIIIERNLDTGNFSSISNKKYKLQLSCTEELNLQIFSLSKRI